MPVDSDTNSSITMHSRLQKDVATMKFLCLAYEEENKLNSLSPEEWAQLKRETLEYVDGLQRRGRLIVAEPLQSATSGVCVRVRDGIPSTTDGPFAETKEQLGGIFLIEAEELDDAIRIASSWPSARIGTIEVRPVEAELRDEGRYAPVGSESGREPG